MFREIRRKDRILDNELAIRLLEEAEYGFLAMFSLQIYFNHCFTLDLPSVTGI